MLDLSQKESIWFERMLDRANMATSYKAYWLKGIICVLIESEAQVISFDKIVCHMIVEAWYPLIQFKLNFGVQDQLGKVVRYLDETYHYGPDVKKPYLMNELYYSSVLKQDKQFQRMKKNFYQMVPYRLLNPFFANVTKGIKDQKKNRLIAQLSSDSDTCFYKIDDENNRIIIADMWADYIKQNQAVIIGWLNFKLTSYLQSKNLSIPNILMKLEPPSKRYLRKPIEYWKAVNHHSIIKDIYTSKSLDLDNCQVHGSFSLDHFVPWSFVLHDELWNLIPTFKTINSSKSDKLPDLERYLADYCHIHYSAFEHMKQNPKYKKILEDYLTIGGNLNSMEILNSDVVVNEDAFTDSMRKAINPIYQIAYNQGFELWEA